MNPDSRVILSMDRSPFVAAALIVCIVVYLCVLFSPERKGKK